MYIHITCMYTYPQWNRNLAICRKMVEGIMLSEVRQVPYGFTYMCNLHKQTNKTKQKQTHRYKEQTDGCQRARVWENG